MTRQRRLRLALGEADQAPRLAAFRTAHPDVVIGDGEFGTWEARFRDGDEETTAVRYTLRELLDRLGALLGEDGGNGPDPERG
ncbi:MAG: hypothetical protein ACRDPY_28345 [Streptosporangiaceae bacterium]